MAVKKAVQEALDFSMFLAHALNVETQRAVRVEHVRSSMLLVLWVDPWVRTRKHPSSPYSFMNVAFSSAR